MRAPVMGSMRTYKNTVVLNFSKRGDNFTLKVPHYKKWLSVIKFLESRGFSVGENPSYKEHYDCLSKYHKIGFKKDVACLMEIGSGFISVEFGNIQNLWKGIAQSFWSDPTDDRYTKLTYLEGSAVKLEIKRLVDFCSKWNMPRQREDSELSPEEYIINNLSRNAHLHGKVTCLNDIKVSIGSDSYDYRHNSNDKNGNKIICGQIKYFYDYYTNRLSCGVAWHNINNMWWVLFGNEKRNIASFELFDYADDIPRKNPTTKSQAERVLSRFEKSKDYQKCVHIQSYINRRFESIVPNSTK